MAPFWGKSRLLPKSITKKLLIMQITIFLKLLFTLPGGLQIRFNNNQVLLEAPLFLQIKIPIRSSDGFVQPLWGNRDRGVDVG